MWRSGSDLVPVLTVFIVRVFLLPGQSAGQLYSNGCPNSCGGTLNAPLCPLGQNMASVMWESLASRAIRQASGQPSTSFCYQPTSRKDSLDALYRRALRATTATTTTTTHQQSFDQARNSPQRPSVMFDPAGGLLRQLPLIDTPLNTAAVKDSPSDTSFGANVRQPTFSKSGFIEGDTLNSDFRYVLPGSSTSDPWDSNLSVNPQFGQFNEPCAGNCLLRSQPQSRLFHRDDSNSDFQKVLYQQGRASVPPGAGLLYPTTEFPYSLQASRNDLPNGLQSSATVRTFAPLPVPHPLSALPPDSSNLNNIPLSATLYNDLSRQTFGDIYNPQYWAANNIPSPSAEHHYNVPATPHLPNRGALARTLSPSWLWDKSIPAPRPLGFVVIRAGVRVPVKLYYLILEHYVRKGWQDVTILNGCRLHCDSFAQFQSIFRQRGTQEILLSLGPNIVVSAHTYCEVINSIGDQEVLLELPCGTRCFLKDINSLPDGDTWCRLLFPPNLTQDQFGRMPVPLTCADSPTGNVIDKNAVNIQIPINRPAPRPFAFVVLRSGERVPARYYYLILAHYLRNGWRDVTFMDGSRLHSLSFPQFDAVIRLMGTQGTVLGVAPNIFVCSQTYCDVIKSLCDPEVLLELPSGARCLLKDISSLPDSDSWCRLLFPPNLARDPVGRLLTSAISAGGSAGFIADTNTVSTNAPASPRPFGFVVLRGGVRVPFRHYYLILDHYLRKGWQDITLLNGCRLRCLSFAQFESVIRQRSYQEPCLGLAPDIVVSALTYCDVIRSLCDPEVALELPGGMQCSLKDLNSLPECDTLRRMLFPPNLAQDPLARFLAPVIRADGSTGTGGELNTVNIYGPTTANAPTIPCDAQSPLYPEIANPVLDRGTLITTTPTTIIAPGPVYSGAYNDSRHRYCTAATASPIIWKKDVTMEPNVKMEGVYRNIAEHPLYAPTQCPPVDSICKSCSYPTCYS